MIVAHLGHAHFFIIIIILHYAEWLQAKPIDEAIKFVTVAVEFHELTLSNVVCVLTNRMGAILKLSVFRSIDNEFSGNHYYM